MSNGIIGFSGFVGTNLCNQHEFDFQYNSKNFRDMEGKHFDELVCCGVSAVKWLANKEPEIDKQNIDALINVLETVTADRFFLISTIDVYPVTLDEDEQFCFEEVKNHAYGTNRLNFELFCKSHFKNTYITRLPGLFGEGLKKNVIFDLLNDNCLEMINPESTLQYYYLANLWKDIIVQIENNIPVMNLFTEPIKNSEIHKSFFPEKVIGEQKVPAVHYDLRTKYSSCWNKNGNYCYDKTEVIKQITEFISNYSGK